MTFTEVILVVVSVVFIYLFKWLLVSGFIRPKKYPPGPQWLPIVGNTPKLRELSKKLGGQHHALTHLAKLYDTNLLGLKLGRELFVVVFSEPLIKQILTRDEFQARPDNFFIRLRSMGTRKGITMTDGPLWEEQRAFAVRHLRELGFGKTLMETLILDELQELITSLSKGGEVTWLDILAPSVLNVLWALAAGKRFASNDPRLKALLVLMERRSKAFDMSGGVLSHLPWLRHVAPDYTGFTLVNNLNAELSQLLMETVEEHKKSLNKDSTRDFIDAFLHQMSVATGKPMSASTFTEDQLIMVCLDFFIAGAQTTSNTLNFALLKMLIYPEIQQRVQEEIDSVLPNGKLPSLTNRASLPYTEAVLYESQRFQHVVPISGPRRVVENTEIDGYIIPKGTTVLYHLHHLHHDNNLWEDPEVFRPERFLDKDGNFCPQQLYLFGYGKRRCIGETLARNFIFLSFVGLLKNYKLTPVSGKEKPSLQAMPGITLSPMPYSAYLTVRH